MARFFKFHSPAELELESTRLGLDIRLSQDLNPLFRPVSLGPLRLGNSLCIQPMEGCDCTHDGRPGELTFRRYRRFGAGGAKLIWGEAAAVVEEGRANPRQLLLNEETASHIGRLVETCRQAHLETFGTDDDLVMGLQLTHSGRFSCMRPLIAFHDPLLDPLTRIDGAKESFVDGTYPLIEDDYLKGLVDHYVRAAKIAYRIGFQFIDIKQCHRYLLNELLAAKTRPGPFGGSLENRTRLTRDIIVRIKSEVPGLIVGTRLNGFDGIPYRKSAGGMGEPLPWHAPVYAWGTSELSPFQADLTEPLAWIKEMCRLGLSIINISMGNPYVSPHVVRPFEYPPPDGYGPPENPLIGVNRHFQITASIQRAFPHLPVVGSGYSYLQEFLFNAGAANIRDDLVTIVGVGRASLPQPDFARQLLDHGRLERRRICRTFSFCTALMRARHNEMGQFATGCPPFDKEVYGPIWESAKKQP